MPNYFEDRNRRTGRTSRMLAEAVKLASEGRDVYVIVLQTTFDFAFEMLQKTQVPFVCWRAISYAAFANGLKLASVVPAHFDWANMRTIGSHPNCVFLLDHEVIERQNVYRAMYDMAHKYDIKD